MSGTSDRDAHPPGGGGDPHDMPDRTSSATDSARNPGFLGVGRLCETAVRQIDELQFTLGEGPCLDAFHDRTPHLVPDLRDRSALERWPVFSGEAIAVGARAVFAFPIVESDHPLGVLELYRGTEGGLEVAAQTAAVTIATSAGLTVRRNWDDYLTAVDDADPDVAADEFSRSQVYLASGMVAVQLAIAADEALDILRAYSYQHGRSIKDVADDIVARRLTLRDTDEVEGR